MRWFLLGFSQYRPRLLTLGLLVLTVALLAFSNLSAKQSSPDDDGRAFGHKSYGWPLIWHRYVLWDRARSTEGWYLSRGRLAANLAIWLLILVVPAGICEWLLRRYRLRLRWSLRTMLAAMGLAGVGLTWFAHARDQANCEDALIEAINARGGTVWVERWGPQWLDLFGVDRFRRRIVGVSLGDFGDPFGHEQDDPQLLERVASLRGLRYLYLYSDEWPPELRLADALSSLPRLEHLRAPYDADLCTSLERLPNLKSLAVSTCKDVDDSHRLLAAVGKLKKLEELRLEMMTVRGSSFACLSGLTELRFLSLLSVHGDTGGLLQNLPPLARLEAIDFEWGGVGHLDVAGLANLPRLRSLNLAGTRVTDLGLLELGSLASLEELTICYELTPPARLAALSDMERLRSLHLVGTGFQRNRDTTYSQLPLDNGSGIVVLPTELWAFRSALETLRLSKPGLLIDNPGLRHSDRSWSQFGAKPGGPWLGRAARSSRHVVAGE